MFYFTASNDDTFADKDYVTPTANSNLKSNYIFEESDNVEPNCTNYSLVGGMYLLFNLFYFCLYFNVVHTIYKYVDVTYIYYLGSKNNGKPFQQKPREKTTSSLTLLSQPSCSHSPPIHAAGKEFII